MPIRDSHHYIQGVRHEKIAFDGTAVRYTPRCDLGDVNEDGHIDVVDLLTLADACGTTFGNAAYDPLCDFNGDNFIDVVDLLALAGNWGL